VQRTPLRRSPCSGVISQRLVARPHRLRNTARQQRAQQQARASETEVDTLGQRSFEALDRASASNDSRTSRSGEQGGPEMPFGLLLGLAAAGTAETSYLTLVRSCTLAARFGDDLPCSRLTARMYPWPDAARDPSVCDAMKLWASATNTPSDGVD